MLKSVKWRKQKDLLVSMKNVLFIRGEKSRNWLQNAGKVALKHARLRQVHFKYFASKDWYYSILINQKLH